MPVGDEALMDGTTLCPHCDTRFRIAGEQLAAHQGMVRCGSCMQPFDARPGFIPDLPDPQLELPILEEQVVPAEAKEEAAVAAMSAAEPSEPFDSGEQVPAESVATEVTQVEPAEDELASEEQAEVTSEGSAETVGEYDGALDFSLPHSDEQSAEAAAAGQPRVIPSPMTLESTETDEDELPPPARSRRWPWILGSSLLVLLLIAQAAYFFRVELGSKLPGLKPALVSYCKLLNCSVPLPQKADLMSIESSELEADPKLDNQITLVALLRNRAEYTQALPSLELSLNDTEDKVLARLVFKPVDYLPAGKMEAAGLGSNQELNIRLHLDTTELRPTGYRLALFYP